MFETKAVGKMETHIECSTTSFPESRGVYGVLWNNTVERGRPWMTTWRMRSAC